MTLRAVVGGGAGGGGGGTVTAVGVTSTDGSLAVTGSPVTTSGTMNVQLNTVPPTKGGTGLTTLGTPGQVLTVNAGGTALVYQTPSAGTGSVSSVGVASNTLAVSNTPITASGNIEVDLPNLTGIPYFNGASAATAVTAAQVAAALGTQNISGNAANVTGTVNPANGGTGVNTLTGIPYGNGTAAFTVATGAQIASALGSNNISGSAANVTGTVTAAHGGTGVTTLSGVVYGNGTAAMTAATGAQIATALGNTNISGNAANVTGVVGYQNGGTGLSTLGTAGQIPTVDPTGTFIQWQTPSGGGGSSPNNGGVIYSKGSTSSITGTTTTTSLRSCTIPANAVAASGAIEIIVEWSWTNSANGKTPAIVLGNATAGYQTVQSTTQTTNNGMQAFVRIANRDVTNQQVVYPSINSFSQTGAAPTYLTVDMTQANTLDFRMTLGAVGDTGSVESVVVKIVNP